ncbi:MAG: NADH-quinone oxidoreductase subunit NuoG, partial [Acidimicrobiales bacterium]
MSEATSTESPPETVEDPRITLTINGVEIKANPGELVIDVAERHGVYIPRFCYHSRMTPVGMCRMCIVEIDTGRGPALQPACMVASSEGMLVDTESPVTKKAQEGILEFLLINHPLDCPVCDKGGECPLQDQAIAFGPGESRFVEEKRHYEKPIPLNDNVALDRERCILCDRCTRFADEIAGDPLIQFTHRGNQTQVLTFPDEPFASYFSGNTVQLCPVGALTAKPYRFKARPWDLEEAESTCTECAVGCRVIVQTSRNEVLRLQGVDSEAVNHGWLCDKGRFGFEEANSDDRLGAPLVREGDVLTQASWSDALDEAVTGLKSASGIGVLGGARLTNERAFAWSELARDILGTQNCDVQLADGTSTDVLRAIPRATIADTCSAGTVLLIGADLKEELPVLYLRLKGAVDAGATQVVEIAPADSAMTRYSKVSVRCIPGELDSAVEAVLGGAVPEGLDLTAVQRAKASLSAGPLVVLVGRSSLGEHAAVIANAVAMIRSAHPEATFLPLT